MEITSNFLESHWPLSNVVVGDILQKSGERITGRLQAKEGEFVYKIADERKTGTSLDKELIIFDFLPNKGFPHITKLLRTRKDGLYHSEENRCIYLLEYVEGKNPEPTPETYRKLGEITAELHAIEGYPYETEFDTNVIAKKDLPERAENFPFKEEYLKLVSSLPDFSPLPKALIHTDIGTVNTIERPDGSMVLIDWDDVGMGPAVLDIGIPLLQQFTSEDGQFFKENAQAFYGAYFSTRTMSPEEKGHIFDAGLFIALDYIIYGDTNKRWQRIQWALEHKKELESAFI